MEEELKKILNQLLDGQEKMNFRLDGIDGRLDHMDSKLGRLDSQVMKNTQILKSLEHAVQVNKAEIDKLSFDVAEMKGDVKSVKNDLSAVERITIKNWGDIVELKSIK